MKIFAIISRGYEQGPEFPTLKQARAALKALRLEDTRRCRARYGKAFVSHPAGRDSFAVTLARDPRSALYSQSMIVRTY